MLWETDWATLSNKTATICYNIFNDNLNKEPGKITIVTDYQVYKVIVSFGGKNIATNDYGPFWFYVCNDGGKWHVMEGFCWNYDMTGGKENPVQ